MKNTLTLLLVLIVSHQALAVEKVSPTKLYNTIGAETAELVDVLNQAVKEGFELNKEYTGYDGVHTDEYRFVPLHFIVTYPQPSQKPEVIDAAIKLLINAGANPNFQDSNGNTAINGPGARYGLDLLLAAKADPNIANKAGETPLYWAAGLDGFYSGDPVMVKKLLDAGANIHTLYNGRHILNIVMQGYGWSTTQPDLVKALIDGGADLNYSEQNGYTPVFYAIHRYPEFIDLLKNKGADFNVVDSALETPSVFAVKSGNACFDYYQSLFKYSNVNQPDFDTKTALMYMERVSDCASGDSAQVAERVLGQLLKAGADITKADYKGRTAVFYLTDTGRPSLFDQIKNLPGFDINSKDWLGKTPLRYLLEESKWSNCSGQRYELCDAKRNTIRDKLVSLGAHN